MNNEPFFAPCNEKKVHTALGDNKVSSPTASEPPQKKKNKCYPAVSERENNSRGMRDMRRG